MRLIESREIEGKSGKAYAMNVYPADMRFNDFIPGVFLLMSADNTLYIGESDNVDVWLQKSEALSKLNDKGFDQIGFIRNGSAEVRAGILSDLAEVCSPELDNL